MAPVHRAIIKPTRTGARGSLFSVTVNGVEIVRGSRQPALDACRESRARGFSGSLEVFHAGSDTIAMVIDIERGAKLAVVENEKQGPRFAAWKPYVDPAQRAGMPIGPRPSDQGAASP